jgi:hypothetical protein
MSKDVLATMNNNENEDRLSHRSVNTFTECCDAAAKKKKEEGARREVERDLLFERQEKGGKGEEIFGGVSPTPTHTPVSQTRGQVLSCQRFERAVAKGGLLRATIFRSSLTSVVAWNHTPATHHGSWQG